MDLSNTSSEVLSHNFLYYYAELCLFLLEPLSDTEIYLLKQALPYNMNIDEPPFRQQLQASLRQALARARDGSLAELKLKNKLIPGRDQGQSGQTDLPVTTSGIGEMLEDWRNEQLEILDRCKCIHKDQGYYQGSFAAVCLECRIYR